MSDRASNVTSLRDQTMFASEMRRIDKGALLGIFDLHVPKWGVVLKDCKWFRSDKGEWIGLPSSSFETREGGKRWKNLVEIPDKDLSRKFQDAALAAVRRLA